MYSDNNTGLIKGNDGSIHRSGLLERTNERTHFSGNALSLLETTFCSVLFSFAQLTEGTGRSLTVVVLTGCPTTSLASSLAHPLPLNSD